MCADNDDAGLLHRIIEEAACLTRSGPGYIRTTHDTHQAGWPGEGRTALYTASTSYYYVAPERGFHFGLSGDAASGFLLIFRRPRLVDSIIISTSEIHFLGESRTKNTLQVKGQKIGYIHADERDLYIRIVPKLHWSPSSRGRV